MKFRFVDEVIGNHTIDLDALQPDTNLYSTLLLQHKGIFLIDEDKFGNLRDCTDLFKGFLRLAQREQTSIAVTPEYSCPWETIEWILQNTANHPGKRKLWALGCESIKPAELRALKERYQGSGVIIEFDDTVLDDAVNVLLNPLCYVFNVEDRSALKLVLLIQFKTEHMGVWTTDMEQEKYIPGKEIYVLRNNPGSIALFTLICSETEKFQISEGFKTELAHRWDNESFIILNIQLNPRPSANFFRAFRDNILNYANKDIISLNWSSKSTTANGKAFIPYGKSSITYSSYDMEFAEESKFIENHKLGLYYTNRQQRRHAYFMNDTENVFLLALHKPISGGMNPSMLKRTGPIARATFRWDGNTATFIKAVPPDDGLDNFLNTNKCTSNVMRDAAITVIDKERLINISIGKVKATERDRVWHSIEKLHTFFLEDDEIIRRMTYVQDDMGNKDRIEYLEKLDTINSVILARGDLFSINLAPFVNNCSELGFSNMGASKYRFNLSTKDGKHRATVAYIGRNTLDHAEKVLKDLWEIFDDDDPARKRVIVWYKPDVHTIAFVSDDQQPTVADESSIKSNSISKQP